MVFGRPNFPKGPRGPRGASPRAAQQRGILFARGGAGLNKSTGTVGDPFPHVPLGCGLRGRLWADCLWIRIPLVTFPLDAGAGQPLHQARIELAPEADVLTARPQVLRGTHQFGWKVSCRKPVQDFCVMRAAINQWHSTGGSLSQTTPSVIQASLPVYCACRCPRE